MAQGPSKYFGFIKDKTLTPSVVSKHHIFFLPQAWPDGNSEEWPQLSAAAFLGEIKHYEENKLRLSCSAELNSDNYRH